MKKTDNKNTASDGLASLIPKSKKILKPKDVQRLMSKLISGFCNGSIKSDEAKVLTYLCSQYISIYQTVELEKRIDTLEKRFTL